MARATDAAGVTSSRPRSATTCFRVEVSKYGRDCLICEECGRDCLIYAKNLAVTVFDVKNLAVTVLNVQYSLGRGRRHQLAPEKSHHLRVVHLGRSTCHAIRGRGD